MIDILLPVYRVNEIYFNELLKSLSKQKCKEFRVLIGYDDNFSEEIILNLLIKFPDINCEHIYNNNKAGIFSNVNNLIKYIENDYIQFLCQDDILYENFLFDNYTALSLNKSAGLAFCQVDWCDEKSHIYKKYAHHKIFNQSILIKKNILQLLFLKYGCIPGNLSPVMVTKNALLANQPFDENLKFASDFDFWCRISLTFDFYYIESSNIVLRKHKLQASETIGIQQLISDRIYIYKHLLSCLNTKYEKFKSVLYLNQTVGANQMLYLIRNINFNFIIKKYKYPFHPLLSFFFLIVTLNGRILYYKNNEY